MNKPLQQPNGLFSKFSSGFNELLRREIFYYETKPEVLGSGEMVGKSITTEMVGFVSYKSPLGSGKIPLHVGKEDYFLGMSVIKTKDGDRFILSTRPEFSNSPGPIFAAMVAHELGHLLSGHLDSKRTNILDLYKEENEKAIKMGDQELHSNTSARSLVDGGHFPLEMEADVVACRFVGSSDVVAMQTFDAVGHENPAVMIEKLNRLRVFLDRYGTYLYPDPEYKLEIYR